MSPSSTPPRIFGDIPGVPIGTMFESRAALAAARIHRPLMKGISGSGDAGADSIVLSGGYEDDRDFGEVIFYTGEGGRDTNSGKQVSDQSLTRGNLALARSSDSGLPIRVSRKVDVEPVVVPTKGYRYDGLYYIEDYWPERGTSGFLVWRFRLRRNQPLELSIKSNIVGGESQILRRATTVQRIVRNTAMAQRIKELYDYRCQVCWTSLATPAGLYAEGAHIRPLGSPHDGPDSEDNILCLCPNHHVLFDRRGFTVEDDLNLVGFEGRLRTVAGHSLNPAHLAYHRGQFGLSR